MKKMFERGLTLIKEADSVEAVYKALDYAEVDEPLSIIRFESLPLEKFKEEVIRRYNHFTTGKLIELEDRLYEINLAPDFHHVDIYIHVAEGPIAEARFYDKNYNLVYTSASDEITYDVEDKRGMVISQALCRADAFLKHMVNDKGIERLSFTMGEIESVVEVIADKKYYLSITTEKK